ncbi:hypothetical protein JCM14635_21830 [Megalodesulfovibrio paquesii]
MQLMMDFFSDDNSIYFDLSRDGQTVRECYVQAGTRQFAEDIKRRLVSFLDEIKALPMHEEARNIQEGTCRLTALPKDEDL